MDQPLFDPLFCAYAAGFIDGEGCLAITSRRRFEGRATYRRLRACLLAIRPYLRVKAARADVMLEFFEVFDDTRVLYGRGGTPGDTEALRRSFYERMKQLRHAPPSAA